MGALATINKWAALLKEGKRINLRMQRIIQKQVKSRGHISLATTRILCVCGDIPVIVPCLQFYLNTGCFHGWMAIIPH